MLGAHRGLHARGLHRAALAHLRAAERLRPRRGARSAPSAAEILAAFRAEDRPAGEVIDDYLARADALMTATHEGRAFEGAFALLRDDALVTQLREDLTALLEHPLADRLLSDADRAELRGTVSLVRDGLDRVLSQRSRVTATLKEYIVSHDAVRDRELEQTLRQVESELMTWMATTGPRAGARRAAAARAGVRGPPARALLRPRRRRAARPDPDAPTPPTRRRCRSRSSSRTADRSWTRCARGWTRRRSRHVAGALARRALRPGSSRRCAARSRSSGCSTSPPTVVAARTLEPSPAVRPTAGGRFPAARPTPRLRRSPTAPDRTPTETARCRR